MASPNSLVLPVASWIDAEEWSRAPEILKQRLIRRACELAKMAKLRQCAAGIGSDGKKLAKRKHPRPDGATGPATLPHRAESRGQKWVRTTPGYRNGTVTIHWSHGWGQIVGFLARGEGRYGPIAKRDIINFPKAAERRLISDVRHYWAGLLRLYGIFSVKPFRHVEIEPTPIVVPIPILPIRPPVAAKPPKAPAAPMRIVTPSYTHITGGAGYAPRSSDAITTGWRQKR